jgi:hypothetical protein
LFKQKQNKATKIQLCQKGGEEEEKKIGVRMFGRGKKRGFRIEKRDQTRDIRDPSDVGRGLDKGSKRISRSASAAVAETTSQKPETKSDQAKQKKEAVPDLWRDRATVPFCRKSLGAACLLAIAGADVGTHEMWLSGFGLGLGVNAATKHSKMSVACVGVRLTGTIPNLF